MGVCCTAEHKLRSPSTGTLIPKSEISQLTRLDSNSQLGITKHYEFLKVLGYGQFGTVREAYKIERSPVHNDNDSNKSKRYAVKSINKDRVKKGINMLKRELETLQILDHPNIIKLYEIYEDSKYIHLVMELCTGGDLFDHLISKGYLIESEVAQIMRKMLSAVNYLHSLHICHRDIKPENFLFTTQDDSAEVKLVDFGMSVKFGDDGMDTMLGTPYYLAPEILKGRYGKECDVWSFGVVMYYLLSGKQPFKGANIQELFQNIRVGKYAFDDDRWNHISIAARQLISKMLTVNPEARINISNALKHEWFNSYNIEQQTGIKIELFNSIKTFKRQSKLWREAMKVFVRNLSEEQLEELHHAFDEIDRSKTGVITPSDIECAMRRNGYIIAMDEFQKLASTIQDIGQGRLNYTQFLIAAMDRKRLMNEEGMWDVFRHFDIDGNGEITVKELKYALEKAGCCISDSDFQEIIEEFHLKGGDSMGFAQFKEIMMCKFYVGFSEESTPTGTEHEEDYAERRVTRRLSMRRITIRRNSILTEQNPPKA